jgi:hypothetical protein
MQFKSPHDFASIPTSRERPFHDLDTAGELPALPKSNSLGNSNWHSGLPKPTYAWEVSKPQYDFDAAWNKWSGRLLKLVGILYLLVLTGIFLWKVALMVWAMK